MKLRLIRRDTIRRNPRGGQQPIYQVAGHAYTETFVTDGVIRQRLVQPYTTLYGLGVVEPHFHFEYEDPVVTCEECGHQAPYSEFEEEYLEYGDDSYLSERICPKCHTSEAVEELLDEKLTDQELAVLAATH